MELDYCISGDVNGPDNKEIIGAAAHTDYGMLALLATDGTPGLQACFSFTSSNYSTILFCTITRETPISNNIFHMLTYKLWTFYLYLVDM